MNTIIVNGIVIDVIRKDVKNLRLTVYPPAGKVRITAPLYIKEEVIRRFASSKAGWIKRHQEKYSAREKVPPRRYEQGEEHYFLGKKCLLNIIETGKTPQVVLRNNKYIDLCIRPRTPLQKRQALITEWYREQIKKHIPVLITKWQPVLDVQVKDWRIKQMKTKWGSCSIARKRICLNLELVKLSAACLEYVVVHELIHLKERLHNQRFYNYLDTCLPNWRERKAELNNFPLNEG